MKKRNFNTSVALCRSSFFSIVGSLLGALMNCAEKTGSDQIPQRILFCDFSDGTGGIAKGQPACGNIFCDNAPCTDYGSLSDLNSVDDRHVGGNPYIVTNLDSFGKFRH